MILEAILKINPNAVANVKGNDINTCEIEWLEGTTPIPKADIEAKMNEMANEPEQSNYAQQRKSAYPEIGDQLDMLWHSIDQDAELKQKYFDFYQAIKSVKVKYPKNG
jgi:alpha-N-acetylglucosamine transferase